MYKHSFFFFNTFKINVQYKCTFSVIRHTSFSQSRTLVFFFCRILGCYLQYTLFTLFFLWFSCFCHQETRWDKKRGDLTWWEERRQNEMRCDEMWQEMKRRQKRWDESREETRREKTRWDDLCGNLAHHLR